jgi:hypothetical protein
MGLIPTSGQLVRMQSTDPILTVRHLHRQLDLTTFVLESALRVIILHPLTSTASKSLQYNPPIREESRQTIGNAHILVASSQFQMPRGNLQYPNDLVTMNLHRPTLALRMLSSPILRGRVQRNCRRHPALPPTTPDIRLSNHFLTLTWRWTHIQVSYLAGHHFNHTPPESKTPPAHAALFVLLPRA